MMECYEDWESFGNEQSKVDIICYKKKMCVSAAKTWKHNKKYFYIKPLKFDSEKGIIKGLTFPLMRFKGYEIELNWIELNSRKLFLK
jgi:hypothetical protein